MALTAISLVLFIGVVASWVKLPGSLATEATQKPAGTPRPELAPQA